jgi:hypothetical protein
MSARAYVRCHIYELLGLNCAFKQVRVQLWIFGVLNACKIYANTHWMLRCCNGQRCRGSMDYSKIVQNGSALSRVL